MAEYYPLLAKAIGSLPNSTPDSRRVVYERARKALIGQLRTLHPPVPNSDIEKESIALDRAVERLEAELANGVVPGVAATPAPSQNASPADAPAPVAATPPEPSAPPGPAPTSERPPPPPLRPPPSPGGEIGPAEKQPIPPVRRPPKLPEIGAKENTPPGLARPPLAPRPPAPRPPIGRPAAPRSPLAPAGPPALENDAAPSPAPGDIAASGPSPSPEPEPGDVPAARPPFETPASADDAKRLKPPQRPIAPQPPSEAPPKRRLWIIPVIVLAVAGVVAAAAWKLRDRPDLLARNKPAEQTQADRGKISERVGEPSSTPAEPSESEKPAPADAPKEAERNDKTQQPAEQQQPAPPANPNPAIPVAHRAALLVEAPDEPNKVKTFLGTVIWKIDNAPQGANAAVGLAVEADVEIPDDKLKAVVIFEKNTDASLPASHTVKVRFTIEPGSFSGNVKQIGALQMRSEASPGVESLAGATVPITTNSFLVGLSPGNAETANTELIRRLQWFDIPLMLESGKIAKLTFEKSDSGQRDLNEAFETWQKQ